MNQEPELQLQLPTFALREVTAITMGVEATLCRWWKWRNDDPTWRIRVRDCVAVLRKLKQVRWA